MAYTHAATFKMSKSKSPKRSTKNVLLRWFHFCCGSAPKDYLISVRRVLWLGAVGVCFYFMIIQLRDCLDKLRHPPVSTQTKVEILDHMDYPAVTFCYKNTVGQGYDLRSLNYFNITGYWIMFDSFIPHFGFWDQFPFGEVNLSTVWEYSTYKFYEGYDKYFDSPGPAFQDSVRPPGMPPESRIVAFAPTFNQIPHSPNGVVTESNFFHDHGLCQTFRPPVTAEKPMPGEAKGYQLSFRYIEGESEETLTEQEQMVPGGMDVYVHDAEEPFTENPLQFIRGEHLYVAGGNDVYIELTEETYSNLDRPEAPCLAIPPESYSHTRCVEHCRWDYLASMAQHRCDAPFMDVEDFEECDNQNATESLFELYQQWYDPGSSAQCEGRCTEACNLKKYSARIIKMEAYDDLYQNTFHIYYPSGQTTALREEWSYDMTLFIADFGGSLGFLLGMSILGMLEIVEGVSIWAYGMLKRWRQRKKRRNLSKEDDASHVSQGGRHFPREIDDLDSSRNVQRRRNQDDSLKKV